MSSDFPAAATTTDAPALPSHDAVDDLLGIRFEDGPIVTPARTGQPLSAIALDDMNEKQARAVLTTEGPLLVLAGAGSGKTRVLLKRIAHIIKTNGVPATAILGITFTRKAAGEMRERLGALLPHEDAQGVTLVTFHALGVLLLRQFAPLAGLPAKFTIVDETDAQQRLRAIHRRLQAGLDDLQRAAALRTPREVDIAPTAPDAPFDGSVNLADDQPAVVIPSVRLAELQDRLSAAKQRVAEMAAKHAFGDNSDGQVSLDLGLPDDDGFEEGAPRVRLARPKSEADTSATTWRLSHQADALVRYRDGSAIDENSPLFEDMPEAAWPLLRSAYREYQEALHVDQVVDYDDLVALTVLLMVERADVAAAVQARWQYVLVDEYQDTDFTQDYLIRLIAGPSRNVCAVGDDGQAIYSFRGAKVENIRQFARRYAPCRTVTLDQNYRSTPVILETANAVLAAYPEEGRLPKILWTESKGGRLVQSWQCSTGFAEAVAVADDIAEALEAREITSYDDVFILFRVNALARPIEEALRRAGIPYALANGAGLCDRADVKDHLALLRLAVNPNDSVALERAAHTVASNVGPAAIQALSSAARANGRSLLAQCALAEQVSALRPAARQGLSKTAEAVDRVVQADAAGGLLAAWRQARAETALETEILERMAEAERNEDDDQVAVCERRLTDLADITFYIEEFARQRALAPVPPADRAAQVAALDAALAAGESAEAYPVGIRSVRSEHLLDELSTLGLSAPPDDALMTKSEVMGSVTLMSVHAAKGLEASRVYVIGMDERLFPISGSGGGGGESAVDEALAEETRLFYVAVTRAKHDLILSSAYTRELKGATPQAMRRSRFLAALKETLYRREERR